MAAVVFGRPWAEVRTAVIRNLQASALAARRRRAPPRWPDPFGAGLVQRNVGRAPEQPALSVVLCCAGRHELLAFHLSQWADQRRTSSMELIVVGADPAAQTELMRRVDDWHRVFGVPLRLVLPGRPPGLAEIAAWAGRHARADYVVIAPAEAVSPNPAWPWELAEHARAQGGSRVLLQGAGGAAELGCLAAPRAALAAGELPPERGGPALECAASSAHPLPQLVHSPVMRRIQAWLYRHKDRLFGFAGVLLALAGRPRHGFFGQIDRCLVVPGLGYLVSGWCIDPLARLERFELRHLPTGEGADLARGWLRIPRPDVDLVFRHFRLPEPPRGFNALLQAPALAARPDAAQVELAFIAGRHRVVLGCVPEVLGGGLEAVRRVMSAVGGQHAQLRVLAGAMLEPAVRALHTCPGGAALEAEVTAYGAPCAAPEVSVVVPLYGRADFMRYQLSQFCRDDSFRRTDLIYVVDDPRLYAGVLAEAEGLAAVFGVPFRVVHAHRNLGFSAANNLGVQHARAPHVLLLNSDVMPRATGWLDLLLAAARQQPDAGAIGATLLFEDGSVQHAGMAAESYGPWDGLDISVHPGKGLREASVGAGLREVEAVTAACMLLPTALYRELGGLSEEFIQGDFEDGDLCRALRARGRRIYVAGAVRLFHLERQSQSLGDAELRTRITLYNCWLYNRRGAAAPAAVPVAAGGAA